MDIKITNVNLLLGKIRAFLDELPEATKKESGFSDADKALAELQKILTDFDGAIEIRGCRDVIPAVG